MACTSCAEARKSQALAQAAFANPAIVTLDAAIKATTDLAITLRYQRRELSQALLRQPLQ